MENILFFGSAIVVGIIVCKFSMTKRWLITFLISTALILIFKILLEIRLYDTLSSDRISVLVGEAFGYALVAGSIGYWIGNMIFKSQKSLD